MKLGDIAWSDVRAGARVVGRVNAPVEPHATHPNHQREFIAIASILSNSENRRLVHLVRVHIGLYRPHLWPLLTRSRHELADQAAACQAVTQSPESVR
jgi:hypothetical protein